MASIDVSTVVPDCPFTSDVVGKVNVTLNASEETSSANTVKAVSSKSVPLNPEKVTESPTVNPVGPDGVMVSITTFLSEDTMSMLSTENEPAPLHDDSADETVTDDPAQSVEGSTSNSKCVSSCVVPTRNIWSSRNPAESYILT